MGASELNSLSFSMLSMSTLYERLKEICRDRGIDAPLGRDIQSITGLSSGRITQIKQEREGAKLGQDALQKLTSLGYSATWLQDGKGEKKMSGLLAREMQRASIEDATPSDDDYALVPQYSARAACGPAYHNGHVEVKGGLAFKRDWLARLGLKSDSLSVIAADGDSMSPTLQDSEVLLIDHSQTEPRDGKVFALSKNGELVVKRLVQDFTGGWIVRSDNADKTRYPDFHVADNALRIVGRVVWHGGGL